MYLRVTIEFWRNFRKCDFWSKMRGGGGGEGGGEGGSPRKSENLFFGSKCSSFILQLNVENRINIRAIYNEIHVFNRFLYGIYMVAILSKF